MGKGGVQAPLGSFSKECLDWGSWGPLGGGPGTRHGRTDGRTPPRPGHVPSSPPALFPPSPGVPSDPRTPHPPPATAARPEPAPGAGMGAQDPERGGPKALIPLRGIQQDPNRGNRGGENRAHVHRGPRYRIGECTRTNPRTEENRLRFHRDPPVPKRGSMRTSPGIWENRARFHRDPSVPRGVHKNQLGGVGRTGPGSIATPGTGSGESTGTNPRIGKNRARFHRDRPVPKGGGSTRTGPGSFRTPRYRSGEEST